MTQLSNQQKELLFDYCSGLSSKEQAAEAKRLISSNAEAAEIHSKLKTTLTPLESLRSESCPEDLAESTISRLNNLARSSQLRLQQLLEAEESQTVSAKSRLWWNLGRTVAAAAVIVFVAGVLIAPLNFARQKSWRHQCQMQLSRIFNGISQYSSDHDGALPAVATTAGDPWWKVGYPGKQNHSNTRHIWLLVKGRYVKPADFLCPGNKRSRAIRFDTSEANNYNDFPGRKYVTYSFRIMPDKGEKKNPGGRKVLIADLNPLFEKLPENYSGQFQLKLDKSLLTINSINHNRRGQNILLGDGGCKFIKKRHTDISTDDIFTLQNTDVYQGVEVPACEADAFLAP
jgi:hypothetical protein